MRLGSRACQPIRRPTSCSRRNAAAARCWSNPCGRPVWQESRRSSSSTCRPPACRRSRGSGSKASRTSRSSVCSIHLTKENRISHRRRSGATTSRQSAALPNGIWGGKLMWNQTPLLLRAGGGAAGPIRRRPARRDPRRRRQRPGPCIRPPSRCCLPSGFVLARRTDPRLARTPRSTTGLPSRVPRRCDRPRRHDAARAGQGLAHLVRRGGRQADRGLRIRCCGATSLRSWATCSRRSDKIAAWHPRRCWSDSPINAPTCGWTATARMRKGRVCRHDVHFT